MAEISSRTPAMLLQVTTWPDKIAALEEALRAWPGQRLPLAPGRWLLVAEERAAEPALDPLAGTVTDLSDARAVFRIEGEDTVDILSKGVGFDLDPRQFAPGAAGQTLIHGMSVLVHRRADAVFDLYVSASFAELFEAWLGDAAGRG